MTDEQKPQERWPVGSKWRSPSWVVRRVLAHDQCDGHRTVVYKDQTMQPNVVRERGLVEWEAWAEFAKRTDQQAAREGEGEK